MASVSVQTVVSISLTMAAYCRFRLFECRVRDQFGRSDGVRQAHTTVNPIKPETTTSMVTSGVYRLSQNPMEPPPVERYAETVEHSILSNHIHAYPFR